MSSESLSESLASDAAAMRSSSAPPPALVRSTTNLPPYSAKPDALPPPYRTPKTFVKPEWVRQHLLVLAAFSQLRLAVETLDLGRAPGGEGARDTQALLRRLDTRSRWGLFVEMAVRRFGIWQEKYVKEGVDDLPPLDVLMVWCAYLGSPRWYSEDAAKLAPYHPSALFPNFPLDSVAKAIDVERPDLHYSPGTEAEVAWKGTTALPFSPIEAFKSCNQVYIICPKCDAMFSVSWLTDDGRGYAQQRFTQKCLSCRLYVTKEALAVRRLVDDLIKLHTATSSTLASYLVTPSQYPLVRASPLAHLMRRIGSTPREIGDRWQWRRSRAILDIGPADENVEGELFTLMSSYMGTERASVDLVAATMRLSFAVERLQEWGHLAPATWDEKVETFEKAIARYTRFLQLAKEAPEKLLVPTYGIDIVWQTHMLLHARYVSDTKAYVGQLFDHHDAVEEGVLSAAFDETAQRWQTAYKALYSTSGHLPPDGSALAKLTTRLKLWPVHSDSPLAHVDYALPFVYDEADSYLSHPSERNTVFVAMDERTFRARQRRVNDFRERLVRDMKREGKGLADASLMRRAKSAKPAFVSDDTEWTAFGPLGYPMTQMGIIATGHVVDSRVIYASGGLGMGAIGAGLNMNAGVEGYRFCA